MLIQTLYRFINEELIQTPRETEVPQQMTRLLCDKTECKCKLMRYGMHWKTEN